MVLLSAIILSSCITDDSYDPEFNYATSFEMIVRDSEGIDLLNPSSLNSLNSDSIKLYYLENGIVSEVYSPNYDHPRNYLIYSETDGTYRIRIFPNDIQTEQNPVTYIKWNEGDTDTITCTFIYTDNAIMLKEVRVNDVFKLDTTLNNGSTFEIVK